VAAFRGDRPQMLSQRDFFRHDHSLTCHGKTSFSLEWFDFTLSFLSYNGNSSIIDIDNNREV
jgi:hypothetical protein